MIGVDYVRTMARYNRWQNDGLIALTAALPLIEVDRDRGAFFGSIRATLNHILWGDRIWMSRIDGWVPPEGGIAESGTLTLTLAAWKADRQRADARLVTWADGLRPAQLRGRLRWYSGALGRDMDQPVALCVAHLFNHQTHHRGQVHAMLTAAGHSPGATDLFAMPEDLW